MFSLKHEVLNTNNIMIIDDSHICRYIMQSIFKIADNGKNIIAMDGASAALDYLEKFIAQPQQLPTLIFLDLYMPDMDGFDFLDQFEKLPEAFKNHCSVIMLSASIDDRDRQKAVSYTYVNGFYTKPLMVDQIKEILVEQSGDMMQTDCKPAL